MNNAPNILVRVEAAGLPGVFLNMTSRVLSMKFDDNAEKADKLSLTVDNFDLEQFDLPIWRTGNTIFIQWGYPEVLTIERKTQIRKVSGFRTLTIEAYGFELLLAKYSRSAKYPNDGEPDVSRAEVARRIAVRWGYLTPEVQKIEYNPKARREPALFQVNQTDLEFMNRLKREEHYDFYIDHDGFHFHSKEWLAAETDYKPVKVFTYYSDQSKTEILDASIENDITVRAGSVGARAHDPISHAPLDIIATGFTEKQKDELSAIIEVPGMGEWAQNIPGMEKYGHHKTIHVAKANVADVIAEAVNARKTAQQEAVKLKLLIVGDPTLLAKTVIEVKGMGARLSQRYWVRSVEHNITNGYTCNVTCVSEGSHGHSVKVDTPIGILRLQPAPANPAHKPGEPHPGLDIHNDKNQNVTAEVTAAAKVKAAKPVDATSQKPVAPATTPAVTPEQPVRTGPPAVNVPKVDTGDGAALGSPGVVRPQLGAQEGELKTEADVASQAELEAAYASTAATPELPDEPDHSRQYLYDTALLPGNVDLDHRPYAHVKTEEGDDAVATVNSMSFQPEESSTVNILIPTVSDDGRLMTGDEAIDEYYRTGKHLGFYKDSDTATDASIKIHLDQVLNPPEDTLAVRPNTRLTPAQRRALETE